MSGEDLSLSLKSDLIRRNYGIDLLRIVSMFYVVILHSLGIGGVLKSAVPGSSQFEVAWFMETWAYCAVNVFAMISGYVGYSEKPKKLKLASIFNMWFQVVVYGVILTLVFKIIDGSTVTKLDLIDMFFPITRRLYWYFTAYVGLFFATPLLNAAIQSLSEKQLKRTFWIIILFYVVGDNLFGILTLNRGYSFAWLVILYLIGAIMKKCDIGKNIKAVQAWLGIIGLVLVSCSWKIWGMDITFLNFNFSSGVLISYVSPTVLGAAVLHIIAFSKMRFSSLTSKIISFFAAGSFAVYIINCQRFVWKLVFTDLFVNLGTQNVLTVISKVVIFSILFVFLSIIIDRCRIFLFRKVGINKLAEKISVGVEHMLIFFRV